MGNGELSMEEGVVWGEDVHERVAVLWRFTEKCPLENVYFTGNQASSSPVLPGLGANTRC